MRILFVAILLSAALAACGETNERDKAVAADPQAKPPERAREIKTAATGEFDASHKGETAPALALERQDGGKLTLAEFRGKPLLVNLWATWCAPCIAEMPALDRLAEANAAQLAVVGVSQDLQGWAKVRPFLAKAKLATMTIALDKDAALGDALGIGGLPTTVLYDAAGREVWRVNGPREWDKPGGFVGIAPPAVASFRAVGNEPGWTFEIVPGKHVKVLADYGEKTATFPASKPIPVGDATNFALSSGARSLSATIARKPCSDGMSDKTYDYEVQMKFDGQEYSGCGTAL